MSEEQQKKAIVWTRPGCSLCYHVVDRLTRQGVEVEERKIDAFHWTFEQFKQASPSWSNLPTIQLPDGSLLKNVKEVDAWLGKDPEQKITFHPSAVG